MIERKEDERERRKEKYHITTSLPARWQTAQHDRFFDTQVWQTWSICRYLGLAIEYFKNEGRRVSFEISNFWIFWSHKYQVIWHYKIPKSKIFKYFRTEIPKYIYTYNFQTYPSSSLFRVGDVCQYATPQSSKWADLNRSEGGMPN